MARQTATGPKEGDVGVAVVGAGYWGPNLVRNLLACDETWLWSVCDLDLERAARVVGRYTSLEITDNLTALLADPRIEGVAIATPVATHHDIAMACIRAGKHVLVEKPLARTVAEAEALVQAADDAGVVLMCDHTYCYTPAVTRIREEIAAGSLGDIQYVDSVRINLGLVQHDTDVFWDLLPHDLSILDSVLPGGFEPTAVSAVGIDPIGAGHLCVGYVTMMLPGPAIAHVHVSWLSPVKIRSVVFGGSKQHLVWDDTNPAQRISLYERGIEIGDLEATRDKMIQYRIGDMHAPALAEHEALQGVVREFARSIREHRAPMTDGRAGLRVMRVLEAAHRSLDADGALVPLVPDGVA
jgi:predicted dehydrogenase